MPRPDSQCKLTGWRVDIAKVNRLDGRTTQRDAFIRADTTGMQTCAETGKLYSNIDRVTMLLHIRVRVLCNVILYRRSR